MGKVKVVLNRNGVRELLKSSEMKSVLADYASRSMSRLKSGYESDTFDGRNRANAMIWAESFEAKRDNSKNNSILKSLRGG